MGKWIAWQLENTGYTTVLQDWDFRPGANFLLEMQDAVKTKYILAILSPDYLDASFTQSEWAAAYARDPMGKQRLLVPVRVRNCDPQGLLHTLIFIDLVDLDETKAKKALLDGVHRQRLKPLNEPSFPGGIQRSIAKQPSFPGAARLIETVEIDDALTSALDTHTKNSVSASVRE